VGPEESGAGGIEEHRGASRRQRGGSALLAVDGLLKRFRRPAWSKRATLGHAHAAPHVLGTLWNAILKPLVAPPLLAAVLVAAPTLNPRIRQGSHVAFVSNFQPRMRVKDTKRREATTHQQQHRQGTRGSTREDKGAAGAAHDTRDTRDRQLGTWAQHRRRSRG
jgi:hypothetical protein